MKPSFLHSLPDWSIVLKNVAMGLASLTVLAEIGIIGDWCVQKGWSISIMPHLSFPIIGITIGIAIFIVIFMVPLPAPPLEDLEPPALEPIQDLSPLTDLEPPPALGPTQDLPSLKDSRSLSDDPDVTQKMPVLTASPHISINVRSFVVPKEGKNPRHSEDKFAKNKERQCYAVADGVARSFLSSEWAQIITDQFVGYAGNLTNTQNFLEWLKDSSYKWDEWARKWISEAKEAGLGDDWEIPLRRGPQATFSGCSLTFNADATITIDVWIVGDAHFFLYRSPKTPQHKLEVYPYTSSADFGPTPETLGLVSKGIDRFYQCLKNRQYKATADDFIVLATDALARWIFLQKEQKSAHCLELLSFINKSEEEFTEFVYRERADRTLEVDDTTMLIISLGSQDSTRQGGIKE